MAHLYCRAQHGSKNDLCPACQKLVIYAEHRLIHCPFQNKKPTCGNCTVHCYKKDMRHHAREVMRYSGPRMIWHHPIMALAHIGDSFRKVPKIPKKKKSR